MTVIQFPSLSIVPLSPALLVSAADFLHGQWHQLYSNVLPRQIVRYQSRDVFQHYLEGKSGYAWLAMHGSQIRGLIVVSSNCVEDLYVHKRYRRRSIATRLIEVAMDYFRQRGFQQSQAGCEDFNHQAIAFWQSMGWNHLGGEPIDVTPSLCVNALVYSADVNRDIRVCQSS